PLRMARDEHPLPRGQTGENFFAQRLGFALQRGDFSRQIDSLFRSESAELLDMFFQLHERLFPLKHAVNQYPIPLITRRSSRGGAAAAPACSAAPAEAPGNQSFRFPRQTPTFGSSAAAAAGWSVP